MKRISALILILLLLCSCAAQNAPSEQGELNDARLGSVAELQKSLFICTVKSVDTKNAVILKYNLDLSEYTVYTVEITDSLDGCTPLRTAKLYQVGTRKEYPERTSMKKGERYAVDAEPWVYGDEVVFLLSPFREAFPQLDAAGFVNGESVSELQSRYSSVWKSTGGDAYEIIRRYTEAFTQMNTVNSTLSLYEDPSRGYEWTPDAAFRALTVSETEKRLAALRAVDASGEFPLSQAYAEMGKILS